MMNRTAVILLASLTACGGEADPREEAVDLMGEMAEGGGIEYTLKGKVLGPDGQVVEKTRVRYEAALSAGGESDFHQKGYVQSEEDGSFYRRNSAMWSTSGQDPKAEEVDIHVELQASDHFGLFEPSPVREITLKDRGVAELELRLGAPRPTVPVRVVDSAGEPVTVYWLQVVAEVTEADGDALPLPQRWGEFPDGTTELAVIDRPFRVKAWLKDGKRETLVGPFDPADLPARIDITLTDG